MEKRRQVIESYKEPENTNVLWLNANDNKFYKYEDGWFPINSQEINIDTNTEEDLFNIDYDKLLKDTQYAEEVLNTVEHSKKYYILTNEGKILVYSIKYENSLVILYYEKNPSIYYGYLLNPMENMYTEGYLTVCPRIGLDENIIVFTSPYSLVTPNESANWLFLNHYSENNPIIIFFLATLLHISPSLTNLIFSSHITVSNISLPSTMVGTQHPAVITGIELNGYSYSMKMYVQCMNKTYEIETGDIIKIEGLENAQALAIKSWKELE